MTNPLEDEKCHVTSELGPVRVTCRTFISIICHTWHRLHFIFILWSLKIWSVTIWKTFVTDARKDINAPIFSVSTHLEPYIYIFQKTHVHRLFTRSQSPFQLDILVRTSDMAGRRGHSHW